MYEKYVLKENHTLFHFYNLFTRTFFEYFDSIGNMIYKQVFTRAFMKGYIEERAIKIAEYIVETKATVRQAAKKFGVSKSTVHKDVTTRLLQINPALAGEARKILEINKKERHIRGGMATREKYLHKTK